MPEHPSFGARRCGFCCRALPPALPPHRSPGFLRRIARMHVPVPAASRHSPSPSGHGQRHHRTLCGLSYFTGCSAGEVPPRKKKNSFVSFYSAFCSAGSHGVKSKCASAHLPLGCQPYSGVKCRAGDSSQVQGGKGAWGTAVQQIKHIPLYPPCREAQPRSCC